jgi:hypothetical protein
MLPGRHTLALLALLAVLGCDRVYVVKGVASAPTSSVYGSARMSDTPIAGVAVTLYVDDGGWGQPARVISVASTTTGSDGRYRLMTIVPGDISKTGFVEFAKSGYTTQRVKLATTETRDDNVSTVCSTEGPARCFVVNVTMVPG